MTVCECVRAELRNRNSLSSPQSLHVLGFATGVNTAIDTITNFNYTKCVLAIVIQVCSQSLQVCSKHGLNKACNVFPTPSQPEGSVRA